MYASSTFLSGDFGDYSISDKLLSLTWIEVALFGGVLRNNALFSWGSRLLSCFWGALIWKKVRIPDSVLLLRSKLDTISDDSSIFNKNVLIKILPPLPGIKNTSARVGGSHFLIL